MATRSTAPAKSTVKKSTAKKKTTKATKAKSSKASAAKSLNAAGKNLVIVESPAKARTVGQILGPKYVVAASQGHLRDLPRARSALTLSKASSRPT